MARTRRKKKRTQNPLQAAPATQAAEKVPKSFVVSRGKLPPLLRQLQHDLRKLMLPHTALHLKEKKRNTLKDFIHVAGPLGVTHFLILSNTKTAPYLRVARCPHGPTLTFKIHSYSLVTDVTRMQLCPRAPASLFKCSPLIVLAGFGSDEDQLKLTTIMFQNIFPAIDVKTVKLATCQRVVLLSYDKETKLIEFRHYAINLQPKGVSRRLRKLVQHRKIPDLRGLKDVSEFVTKIGYGSESEAEDESATVNLVSDYSRINRASQQSAVKLHEVGPRLTLQLVKVEGGLCSGAVMFHEYVKKTPEEIAAQQENKQRKDALRRQRRAEQEANVQRKEFAKQAQKLQSVEVNQFEHSPAEEQQEVEDEMNDAEWYRQEVGEEPDADFLHGAQKGARGKQRKHVLNAGKVTQYSNRQPFQKGILAMKGKGKGKEKVAIFGNRRTNKEHRQSKIMDSEGKKKTGVADEIISERKRARLAGANMHARKKRKIVP
eukprot:c24595_g1_i1 orf=223-1686(+)